MSEPTIHEVSKELATLGERMNTHQAKYESALDRFRADMGGFRADMSKNDTAFERLRTDMANNLAKNQGAFEELRIDMANNLSKNQGAFEELRTDMAKRDAETAQREINRIRWLAGIWIAGVLVTIAALGIFIRLMI